MICRGYVQKFFAYFLLIWLSTRGNELSTLTVYF